VAGGEDDDAARLADRERGARVRPKYRSSTATASGV
jgi:hypothetical protein